MSDAPLQIPPEILLTVTMTAERWRAVCSYLAEQPLKHVGPLVGEIERQCVSDAAAKLPAFRAAQNGEDRAHG